MSTTYGQFKSYRRMNAQAHMFSMAVIMTTIRPTTRLVDSILPDHCSRHILLTPSLIRLSNSTLSTISIVGVLHSVSNSL